MGISVVLKRVTSSSSSFIIPSSHAKDSSAVIFISYAYKNNMLDTEMASQYRGTVLVLYIKYYFSKVEMKQESICFHKDVYI